VPGEIVGSTAASVRLGPGAGHPSPRAPGPARTMLSRCLAERDLLPSMSWSCWRGWYATRLGARLRAALRSRITLLGATRS
jgi:hypothetical protein